jgi:hypothetical protein
MKRKRTHILLPQALIREIDRMVGPRGRSAFLVETAQEAVKRRKLLQFLENDEQAWKDGAHPEMSGGSAVWVKKLRKESDDRRGKARRQGKRGRSRA